MGQDRTIAVPHSLPPWNLVATRLPFTATLRMIDGQLAFPDEQPPEDWRELRVGTPAGMVTLRHESNEITLVVWGNADSELLAQRDALAEAIIAATSQ